MHQCHFSLSDFQQSKNKQTVKILFNFKPIKLFAIEKQRKLYLSRVISNKTKLQQRQKHKNTCFNIFLMSNSKSPKKDSVPPPPVDVDPQMKERARKAQAQHSKKKEDLLDKYSYHIVFGILILLLLIALVNSLWKSGPDVYTTLVNDADYIAKINSQDLSFKVGATNMFEGYTLVDAKKTINAQSSNKQQLYKCNPAAKDTIIPDTYNFRTQYPNCAKPIYTQGNCSSSYSIASVTAISDRICKQSNGENTFQASPQSPVFCDKFINSQCKGGFISRTLDYAKLYGLVDTICLPYNSASEDTPQTCQEKLRDCKKINIGDYCVSSQTENIKLQIFNYGPVVTTIPIYRDFLIYKEGLYQVYPKNQRFSTQHAVKIIGWDLIDGKNAWIIQNSWGSDWGVNGTAYVVAQSEELHLERFTLAVALNQESDSQTEAIQTETLETEQLEQTQTEQVQEIDL